MNKSYLILCLLNFLFLSESFSQQKNVKTIFPDKDNTLFEDAIGGLSNGQGEFLFVGKVEQRNNGLLRRALLKFTVSGQLPAGVTVDSVRLILFMDKSLGSTRNIKIYAVTSDWGEGNSNASSNEGGGTTALTNDATWKHSFFPSKNWVKSGGDYNQNVSATQDIALTGSYIIRSSQLKNDVIGWLNNPASEFGWIIIGDETTFGSALRFVSRNNSDVSKRPKLEVYYSTPTSVTGVESLPDSPVLYQNYPNPFNPSTVIEYSLPQAGFVKLKVFDSLGREITTLVDEFKAAGNYSSFFTFGSSLSTGVYIYRLQAGTKILSKKMTIIK